MSETRLRWVLCYDVPDQKRRTRLAKCLDGYGDRIQWSVFEAVLDRPLFDKMMDDVNRIFKPEEDSFAAYCLCSTCNEKRILLGRAGEGERIGEEAVFIA